jgi:hypothetical protein
MRRASLLFLVISAGGLPLAASVYAKPTSMNGCLRATAIPSVFPKAKTVGFSSRDSIERVGRRQPFWPGWCGNWSTTYRGYGGDRRAKADVRVSLYRTRSNALAAFSEPLGTTRTLPNGLRLKTLPEPPIPGVASVVRHVFILSTGSAGAAVQAQLRIHRRIDAAVLRWG